MARQSAFLTNLEAKHKREMTHHVFCALQRGLDAATIAANEVFGMGPKRAAEFRDAYQRIVMEISELTLEDAKHDKSIEYTKAKVDEALKRICGEEFRPWEERYG